MASSITYQRTPTNGYTKMLVANEATSTQYEVDLTTGQALVLASDGTTTGDRRCLTSDDLQTLHSVLSNAQICTPQIDEREITDRVCAMIYKAPYASLEVGNQAVALGEMKNGCDVPTDLCDDRAAALQTFVQELLAKIDSQACL